MLHISMNFKLSEMDFLRKSDLHLLLIVLVALLNISEVQNHDPLPTYFRKKDGSGNLIDRANPKYDQDIPKVFSATISSVDASEASLEVTPTVVQNGGSIKVAWSSVTNPSSRDFVAFYCPADDNLKHYIDFLFVNGSRSWSKGFGNLSLVAYNMRTTCVFKYFRNNQISQLVAVSNELNFANGGSLAPLQGHIAMTDKASEMRIMWTSGEGYEAAHVRYGLTPNLDQTESKVDIQTYDADSMCEGPANSTGFWHPGYMYDVLLSGLQPNTRYYYSFGIGQFLSDVRNFTTPLPTGDKTSYKFITYGDMAVSEDPGAMLTAKLIENQIMQDKDIRLIYHHGDVSYAEGHAYIWDQYMHLIEPYASLVPYMVGIGNHEQDHMHGGIHDPSGEPGDAGFRPKWGDTGNDSGGECGVPMYKRFHMPDNGNKVWWYSFDYGMVHYVMMSTENDFTPGSRQYNWLENDLKNVNRTKTPWLIFAGHRPMYTSALAPGDYIYAVNMQRLFEDLLYKYKVDLAFWSHLHSYERTCKVYKNECRDDGIVHLIVGTSGKTLNPDKWMGKKWSAFHKVAFGYGVVTVVNSTSLYWEWIQNDVNKVMDDVWIHKFDS